MTEQLTLEEEFICDGCEQHAFGHEGKIPDGWKVNGSARLCGREKGKRWSEVIELHWCDLCQRDPAGCFERLRRRAENVRRAT